MIYDKSKAKWIKKVKKDYYNSSAAETNIKQNEGVVLVAFTGAGMKYHMSIQTTRGYKGHRLNEKKLWINRVRNNKKWLTSFLLWKTFRKTS